MAASLSGVLMIGKLVKSIFMLGFYAVGVCGVVGTWDYTRQAKAADYVYSFEDYKKSVVDRYGPEASIAFAVIDAVKTGAAHGLELAERSGMLASLGISLPRMNPEPSDATSGAAVPLAAPIVLASAGSQLAPESSLYPRARVLQ